MPARAVAYEVMSNGAARQSDTALVGWRRRLLVTAGFDQRLADELAADARADLHALLDLVDRGCPPRLAARILAPLDEEDRR
jgi:hypothetical protein